MADFAKVATEVFKILNSFNYTMMLYNDESNTVSEPEEARRFYSKSHNLMVAISDNDDKSSVKLFYGKSTHASQIQGLMDKLRISATGFGLTFQSQQFDREITPKDASNLASISEKKKEKMITSLTEGMYGTSRSSYLRMENAKMIVRHSDRINDSMIGARGRMVEKIFIENVDGERLLFPSTQIAPARAMTQHVNQGGTFADQIGGQIMRMTTDYASLGQASNFVASNAGTLQEGAMAVREACRSNMRSLRKTFERLSRPSSYIKESAKIIEQANMLAECGEEEIDETRLSELRQLLNDADLPKSVYECACRAMDKMKEETPITEEEPQPQTEEPEDADDYTPPVSTIGVLGNRVNIDAWNAFKAGDLELKVNKAGQPIRPHFGDHNPEFPEGARGAYAKLCFNLGGLIPVVKDESLANLFQNVLQGIQGQVEGEPNSVRAGEKQGRSAKFADMVKVATHALKLARDKLTSPLATNNNVVREYLEWLNKFDSDRILSEDVYSNNPAHPDYGADYETAADNAMGEAVADFDPQHFIESPEMKDIVGGRDPSDPEENTLTRDEIISALSSYFTHYIEMHSGAFDDGFNEETTELAEQVYDRACEALQGEGFVVDNEHNVEALDEFSFGPEDNVLDVEDIMLPTGNQGDSLIKQVTKQMVNDPDTKGEKKPDSSYINRLQALGWMTTGPNGQAY